MILPSAGFTAHNVRLDDGSWTCPQVAPIVSQGDYACVRNLLPILYPQGWQGRSIVDLGCLEGGFATEFARLGLESTGIEVRERNLENAREIQARTSLPNLRFVRDDAWNLGAYGPFDLVFCVGLHYHIEDQQRFLAEMGKACRRAIFIDTHVAPEYDDDPGVAIHGLSPLTTHEGLPGRWYAEHDLDPAADEATLETMRWHSWENRRSFWPTKGALIAAMRAAGFTVVLEDFDQLRNLSVHLLSPDGWHHQNARAMFVGIKEQDVIPLEAPGRRPLGHGLDGGRRSFAPEPESPPPTPPPPPEPEPPAELVEEIARLRAALDEVQASSSWKLTAPLRALGRLTGR